jgi:hypothetical protein
MDNVKYPDIFVPTLTIKKTNSMKAKYRKYKTENWGGRIVGYWRRGW